jgi:hypothetical protein
MSKKKHIIYGVHITDRIVHVSQVQEVLTAYGKNIKTRLGLHEISETENSPNGLLILEMAGDEAACEKMFAKLNAIEGVEAKKIIFDHP